MTEKELTIARLGLTAAVIFVPLLAAVFLRWLYEHDISVFKPILKFLRRPVGEVLIVLACVGGLVQHGATKGFFGGTRMAAPREMQTELASAPQLSTNAWVGVGTAAVIGKHG